MDRAQSRFNPRAREGRDDTLMPYAPQWGGFNPRAREGRDLYYVYCQTETKMFQSTRPRGARPLTDKTATSK